MEWYAKSGAEVLRELAVDATRGLSDADVVIRAREHGRNALPHGKQLAWWQLVLRQFINPLIAMLLIAAGLTLWLYFYGDRAPGEESPLIDFSVIMLAVALNVAIGFWQEYKSSQIFQKLQQLVSSHARVIRNGAPAEIDAEALVPGDILLLRSGMRVPADARILETRDFTVNESLLTGESRAVTKHARELTGALSVGDRKNMVHMGSVVDTGEAKAVIVAIGQKTELGHIAELTAGVDEDTTPLQERLAGLSKVITYFVLAAAAVIFYVGVIDAEKGEISLIAVFTTTVAVIVAAIPEGLPAALSVVLAVSAQRILGKKGLVKKLIGAETLGSASVIVSDKTGTLTKGEMTLETLLHVSDEKLMLASLVFANEAIVEADGKTVHGEETDRAKLQYAIAKGVSPKRIDMEYIPCALIPFNAKEKYIISLRVAESGEGMLFVSGAPETLLARSTLSKNEQDTIIRTVEEEAAKGYRIIASAVRVLPKSTVPTCSATADIESQVSGLTFLGIALLRDPIREDVKDAVRITREAGIRIIMATGDHRLTAVAIGNELGFSASPDAVLLGSDIDALSDHDLSERLKTVEILSRVSPEHKMRVVEMLRSAGEVVAMTGDGVNDAPGLKAADLGVALESGSDVSKEAADLVLLDNSFTTIVEAIRQGRIAFDNIRKVVVFLLGNSFTEIILVLAALVMDTPLPMTAAMILWANLVEDGFPNFALAFEPGQKNIMQRRPIQRNEKILDGVSMAIIFVVGIIADLLLLGVFFYLYFYELELWGIGYIQTIIFAMLATNSLIYVFSIKALDMPIWKINLLDNTYLLFASGFGLMVMGLAIYAPPLQYMLGTESLHPLALVGVFGIGLFQVAMIEIAKWVFYRRPQGAQKQRDTLPVSA